MIWGGVLHTRFSSRQCAIAAAEPIPDASEHYPEVGRDYFSGGQHRPLEVGAGLPHRPRRQSRAVVLRIRPVSILRPMRLTLLGGWRSRFPEPLFGLVGA